jgi:hypothetical protein
MLATRCPADVCAAGRELDRCAWSLLMLAELGAVLANVPRGAGAAYYGEAILRRNILGKTTESTRQKSLRHLRELYAPR